jgi:hypothetical protein
VSDSATVLTEEIFGPSGLSRYSAARFLAQAALETVRLGVVVHCVAERSRLGFLSTDYGAGGANHDEHGTRRAQ